MLNQPTERLALYNSLDTTNTAKLVKPLIEALTRNGQLAFFERWFREMVPVVMAMQARGVGVLDLDARNQYRSQLRAEIRPLEEKLLAACPLFDQLEAELRGRVDTYRVEFPTRQKMADKKVTSGLTKIQLRRSSFFN